SDQAGSKRKRIWLNNASNAGSSDTVTPADSPLNTSATELQPRIGRFRSNSAISAAQWALSSGVDQNERIVPARPDASELMRTPARPPATVGLICTSRVSLRDSS